MLLVNNFQHFFMKISDTVSLSLLALRRRKFRSFLTMFAVFIGVFIIIILISLSNGAQHIILSQLTSQFDLKSIFVIKKGALNLSLFSTVATEESENKSKIIDDDAVKLISSLENIENVSPILSYTSKKFEFEDKNFDDRIVENTRGAGWDLNSNDSVYGKVIDGKITGLKLDEVIITKTLADAYAKNYSEYIGKTVIISDQPGLFGSQSKPMEPKKYIITGIIENVRDFTYLTSLDSAIENNYLKNGYESALEYIKTAGYQTLYVKATSETAVKNISKEIQNLGFDSTTLEDVLTVFNTFFSIIPIIFSIVGLIAIFVAAVGIINTMVMSVYERTKEIGVMKAIGAKNSDILSLFIIEAGFIGFFGGLMAVLTSLILMFATERLLIEKVFVKLEVTGIDKIFITPPELILIALVFSTAVGVVAGIYPAFRASRLNPVESLRHE